MTAHTWTASITISGRGTFYAQQPFGSPEEALAWCLEDFRRRIRNVLGGLDWQSPASGLLTATWGSLCYEIMEEKEDI